MGEYVFNTDEKIFVNKFDYYPTYLLGYLEAFGVEKYDNCFLGSEHYLNRTKLYAVVTEGYIFLSPCEGNVDASYVDIARDGNHISYNYLGWRLSIHWDYDSGSLHLEGNKNVNYRIKVQQDQLGNVSISFLSHEKKVSSVVIYVGEEQETPQSYIDKLREETDYRTTDLIESIIGVMFSDPRVLNYLTALMRMMPEDIDEVCKKRIDELTKEYKSKKATLEAEYKRSMATLDSEHDEEINKLREYKDACKASIVEKGKGVKW